MANALWWIWNDGIWWFGLWMLGALCALGAWVGMVTALRDEYGLIGDGGRVTAAVFDEASWQGSPPAGFVAFEKEMKPYDALETQTRS